jgi:lipoprotein NlpD
MLAFYKRYLSLFFTATLAGCGSNLAPVTELKWQPYSQHQKTHRVQRGETLYAIAFRYDTDFRTLARLNRINPPYSLRVGQILNLQGITPRMRPLQRPMNRSGFTPIARSKPIYSPIHRGSLTSSSGWLWPVHGRVVISFAPQQGKKGINIACKNSEKVIAASGGIVAYAGSGLAGYGNLIIIKHNNEYLTAYGNNAKLMVSEGERVKAGQTIAVAGVIEHRYTGVHFEIRRLGIPVNPLNYLQKS